MAVKTYAFNFFPAVASVILVLVNWASCAALRMLAPTQNASLVAKILC
jgi:hypothetical protein